MGSAAGASGFAADSSFGVDDAVSFTDFLSARSLLFGVRSFFFRELRGGVRSLSLPLLLLLLLLLLRPRRLRSRSLRLCRDFLGGVRSPLSDRTRPLLLLALRGGVLSPLFERFRALSLASRGGVFSSSRSFFTFASSLGFDFRGDVGDLRASRGGVRSALGERDFSFAVNFLTGSSSFTTGASFTSSLVLLTSALLGFFSASFESGCCLFAE